VSQILSYRLLNSLADFDIVTTEDGSKPTTENSRPLPVNEEAWGTGETRGSLVWFNQASMFQTSELKVPTVAQGKEMGIDTTLDVDDTVTRKRPFQKVI
jgi:hypothetical protein